MLVDFDDGFGKEKQGEEGINEDENVRLEVVATQEDGQRAQEDGRTDDSRICEKCV